MTKSAPAHMTYAHVQNGRRRLARRNLSSLASQTTFFRLLFVVAEFFFKSLAREIKIFLGYIFTDF